MNQQLGSKGGKKDLKIYLNNKKREKKKQEEELIDYRKRVRRKNIILNNNQNIEKKIEEKKEEKIIPQQPKKTEQKVDLTQSKQPIEKNVIKIDKHDNKKIVTNKQTPVLKNNPKKNIIKEQKINIEKSEKPKENKTVKSIITKETKINIEKNEKTKENKQPKPTFEKQNITKKNVIEYNYEEKKTKTDENIKQITPKTVKKDDKNNKDKKEAKPKANDLSLIEGQILTVLDQTLEDNKFELKKIDSELFSIQKSMEQTNDLEELDKLEKEIDILIEKLNYIKKQIESIIKTFDSKIPIEIPDNYLIYLVDEYKNSRKQEIDLAKKLESHQEFKSVIDKIIQIETDKEEILEKLTTKKNDYNIQEEEIEKMNEQVINIEDINNEIKKMMENQEKLLKEIEAKVNETVHITEKVDYISEYVKHSILDLFILMSMLKRNLSLKNNAVTAISTTLILNQIMRLTTPNIKKETSLVTDLKDYKDLINNCMSDTNNLLGMIHSNLDQVSAIRYTFLNTYKECSYLDSYKEVLKRLDEVEDNIKEKEKEVIKIEKDIQYQLEKNNAKVKKYEDVA